MVTPPAAADRNAVMRRPGGGQPDPFAVGTSDYDADDFFSQFTPKRVTSAEDVANASAESQAGSSGEPQLPSRRSRRRFQPKLYDTSQVPEVSSQSGGDAEAASSAQPSVPAPAAASEPAASAQPATPAKPAPAQPAQQAPQQQPEQPAMPEQPAQPQQSPFSAPDAAGSGDASMPPMPPLPPQSPFQPPKTVQMPQAPRSNAAEPAENGAPTVQMPQAPQTPAAPAPQRQTGDTQTGDAQRETPQADQPKDVAARDRRNAPSLPEPGMQQGSPMDNSFTQVIKGLPQDPADQPIAAPQFDKTGVVPLPALPAADPQQRAARDRAAAFYTGEVPPNAQPSQPRSNWAQPTPPSFAANTGEQAEPPVAPKAVTPGQEPIDSPFISDSTSQPAASASAGHGRSEPEVDDFARMLGFGDDENEPEAPASNGFAAGSVADAGLSKPRNRSWKRRGGAKSNGSTQVEVPDPAAGALGAAGVASANAAVEAAAAAPDSPFMGSTAPVQNPPAYDGANWQQSASNDADLISGSATGGASGFGGGGSGGGESSIPERRRGVAMIMIAAAAALVLILGTLVITGLFGGGKDEATAPDSNQEQSEPAPNSEGNGEASPSDSETEAPAADFEPVAFTSESGNIRCQITKESGVACQILERNFSLPDGECRGQNYSGAAVGLDAEGATFPCLQGDLQGSAIPYDQEVKAGQYTCAISFETGVRCDNGKGSQFVLEYETGILVTGNPSPNPHPDVAPLG
ncbi:hypothetical protein [Gulosibacter bifidus]|uniref:hypothetical protein n=1 Tax=Gulosibacter bifidus TaxID=272239 RepID=UPI00135207C2|nr:hypothetical protein [Gulosibacter bifidus]